jgi:hypothetical protein
VLENEIQVLRKKLSEIDVQREALLKSIKVLEGVSDEISSEGSSNSSSYRSFLTDVPDATGLRDQVRKMLKEGALWVDDLDRRLKESFPPYRGMSPRALETCLYKLQKRNEIQTRKEGGRKSVSLT